MTFSFSGKYHFILPCDSGTIRTDSKIFFRQPTAILQPYILFPDSSPHKLHDPSEDKGFVIAAQVAQPSDILAQAP